MVNPTLPAKILTIAVNYSLATGVPLDIAPHQMAIDSMLLGLAQIRATPLWEDARTQFSAVLTRYCEMVDQSPTLNASQIRPAWAELAETQEISDIATARLAARLGFPSE